MVKRVGDAKIVELKRFIAASRDASDLCKKAVFHLINQSCGLTKGIHMGIAGSTLGREIGFGVHNMNSQNRNTLLDEFLEKIGLGNIYFGNSCNRSN